MNETYEKCGFYVSLQLLLTHPKGSARGTRTVHSTHTSHASIHILSVVAPPDQTLLCTRVRDTQFLSDDAASVATFGRAALYDLLQVVVQLDASVARM